MKDNPAEPLGLKELVEKKIDALTGFLRVTKSLYECLLMREIGDLGRLLEERQILIDSVEEIDIQIAEGFSSNPGLNPPAAIPRPIAEALKKIKVLLRELAELDRKCLNQGQFLRDQIQNELFSMRQGLKAARQYTQRSALQPRFMDLRQ